MNQEHALLWLRAELCAAAVGSLAAELAPEGITLLAFKGLHLALGVAKEPWQSRPFADADTIVVAGSFRRAVRKLASTGRFRVRRDDWSCCMVVDERDVPIDLHRRALPAFFGAVSNEALLRRASPAPAPLTGVLFPDLVDAAALAIAHFVKDKNGRFGHGLLATDLALLSSAGVTPKALASRLAEHKLRRVGLVALRSLAEADPRWGDWYEVLHPSNYEHRYAAAVGAVFRGAGPKHRQRALAFLAAHTIGDDLSDAAANFVLGTAVRLPYIAMEVMDDETRWVGSAR